MRIYAPVVYGFARRKGLQDSDAADVTQEVLRSVVAAIEKFTSSRPDAFEAGYSRWRIAACTILACAGGGKRRARAIPPC